MKASAKLCPEPPTVSLIFIALALGESSEYRNQGGRISVAERPCDKYQLGRWP